MKNQLTKFLKLYTAFILLSIVTYSCCNETRQITGVGTFKAYEIPGNETNIITQEFELVALFETNFSMASMFKLNLTQSAYATSCDVDLLNSLLLETLSISTNKDFVFDGQTIAANSNILDIAELNEKIFDGYQNISLLFTNDILDKTTFENEEYTFKINIETTDGLQLENERTVTFDF